MANNGQPRVTVGETTADPRSPDAICMTPECGNRISENGRRGLCQPCYNAANLLVAAGRTQWRKLEKAGKCLKPKPKVNEKRIGWFLEKKPRASSRAAVAK